MAIQFNVLPFKLHFKIGNFGNESIIIIDDFFETESELLDDNDNKIIEIKENIPFQVLFDSTDPKAKFYMDGLESIPERLIKTDQSGIPFISSSSSYISLYQMNSEEFYPFIPGLYRIRIVAFEKQYFTWLKVLPNRINENQWEIMREEVEKEIRGLAQDLVRSSYGFSQAISHKLSPTIIRQFMVIEHNFPAIMAAINDLYRKVNFKLVNKYMLVPQEQSNAIDEISIRYRVMNPETKNFIMTPYKKINYNLPENRLAKQIINFIINKLSEFISSVELYIGEINKDILMFESSHFNKKYAIVQKRNLIKQLQLFVEKANKMRGMLNWIKTAPWYKDIQVALDARVPHVMSTDVRYRTLFQVQRELQKESIELSIDKSFSSQWKRTDKLYEVWGFLQLIKILQHDEIGFKPKSGWIFNERLQIEKMLIPIIPKGTSITFTKSDLTINLIYEGTLPPTSDKTSPIEQPLYTRGTNNCPDGRIDVYQQDIYLGSLIIDFKYRAKNSIWDNNRILNNIQTNTMKQLISYATQCRSDHVFGDKMNKNVKNSFNPVLEVWALFPNQYTTNQTDYFDDHGIRLIELTPAINNVHLLKEIQKSIEKIVDRSRPFFISII